MMWLAIVVFILIIAVMVINLSWEIQKSNIEHRVRMDKLKVERDHLAMKQATKLSYGEKQRLNFALGKHWKR